MISKYLLPFDEEETVVYRTERNILKVILRSKKHIVSVCEDMPA